MARFMAVRHDNLSFLELKHLLDPGRLVAIGFSTSGSSLFLGDGEDSIGFDSEGRVGARKRLGVVLRS